MNRYNGKDDNADTAGRGIAVPGYFTITCWNLFPESRGWNKSDQLSIYEGIELRESIDSVIRYLLTHVAQINVILREVYSCCCYFLNFS